MKNTRNTKKFLLIVCILLVAGALATGGFFWLRRSSFSASVPGQTTNQTASQPTSALERLLPQLVQPTTDPFAELTIPYLRNRTYTSQLGELRSVGRQGNYESFLTSYDSDGLRIDGLLTRPTGEMPAQGWPAIVFIHGYIPPTQYETQERYVDYVNFLARNGFVVFKIDLRGHGDSEGEPGGAYYSSDYVIDALNASSALANSDFVNPSGIGLWGHSMAGNVVLRAMAAKPEIPAAVIWAGAGFTYEDLQEFGIDDNSYRPPTGMAQRQRRRQQLFDTHGQFDPDNPFWATVTPTSYLNDLQGAIQLHHAVDDDVVSVEYSRTLDTALDETTVPHQLFEYPSGGHNLSSPSFTPAMQRTVEFFREYLNP